MQKSKKAPSRLTYLRAQCGADLTLANLNDAFT